MGVKLTAVLVSLAVWVARVRGGSRRLVRKVAFYLKTWYRFLRFFAALGTQASPVEGVGVFRFSRTFSRKVGKVYTIWLHCSAANCPLTKQIIPNHVAGL